MTDTIWAQGEAMDEDEADHNYDPINKFIGTLIDSVLEQSSEIGELTEQSYELTQALFSLLTLLEQGAGEDSQEYHRGVLLVDNVTGTDTPSEPDTIADTAAILAAEAHNGD